MPNNSFRPQYWSEFTLQPTSGNKNSDFKPAIFTFSGPAFQGISPQTCTASALSYLASQLFVIDPVYGVLRALDGIQPYRLEMACRGVVKHSGDSPHKGKNETLASFWKESVTSFLAAELTRPSHAAMDDADAFDDADDEDGATHQGPILANLASEEYSSSIHIPSLPRDTIFLDVRFRHKGRALAIHAKRARGLMARYLAEREATTLEDVSEFDWEGYRCVDVEGGTMRQNEERRRMERMRRRLWEVSDVVGDNVRIVTMVFDREDVSNAESSGGSKGASKEEAKSRRKKSTSVSAEGSASENGKRKRRRS